MSTTTLALDDLLSDDFSVEIGVVSSPRGLRRALYKSMRMDVLKRAISSGIITESDIRQFTEHLMLDFERGVKFPHELALASLAVALENRRTSFVEEYLLDLARLSIVEMSLAPGVARDSMRNWIRLPRTRIKRVTKAWSTESRTPTLGFTKTSETSIDVHNRSSRQPFTNATS